MNALDIQKLRDLPIEGVAERLGLHVNHHKSLCPFHADTNPSLSFNVRRNSYRCFVCGASGNTIDLVMKHLHLSFHDACRWLANRNNIILEEYKAPAKATEAVMPFNEAHYLRIFEHPFLSKAARQFLFGQRRLSALVVERCRLSSWTDARGIQWLQIPYFDTEGKLIGVQSRNLGYPNAPRFRFPRGSQCSIYNLPVVNHLVAGDDLFLTEGCSDCWAMLSAGKKAIAIPSATMLKRSDKELLKTLVEQKEVKLHMYPDHDAPGERLFLQLKETFANIQHHDLPPGCKDFSEYYLRWLDDKMLPL